MEKTNVIKLRFLKNGIPAGREYTYLSPCEVAEGDYVEAPSTSGTSTAIVTAVNVPEAEIAAFRDRAKSIIGRLAQESKAEFKAKQIHCGQYKPYGDFFQVWDIETDCEDKSKVIEYCFTSLYQRHVPESGEYHANIRYGASKSGDANYYFAGYYELEKTGTGWKFTVCEPFAD